MKTKHIPTASEMGRKGATNGWAKRTKAERAKRAKLMNDARWKSHRESKS